MSMSQSYLECHRDIQDPISLTNYPCHRTSTAVCRPISTHLNAKEDAQNLYDEATGDLEGTTLGESRPITEEVPFSGDRSCASVHEALQTINDVEIPSAATEARVSSFTSDSSIWLPPVDTIGRGQAMGMLSAQSAEVISQGTGPIAESRGIIASREASTLDSKLSEPSSPESEYIYVPSPEQASPCMDFESRVPTFTPDATSLGSKYVFNPNKLCERLHAAEVRFVSLLEDFRYILSRERQENITLRELDLLRQRRQQRLACVSYESTPYSSVEGSNTNTPPSTTSSLPTKADSHEAQRKRSSIASSEASIELEARCDCEGRGGDD
ncbi:hypothetical protein C1H76_5629 [Elsinoe australis]|uniref:Uncharacterized protein n=1 Tax=Elsinoe australis TaxID=40998 RepID=A0A4U7AUR3_9PEZI|nr:hypothetical protein C1H76_5629 [Elsinoe australis]